ncbi:hypothetical protein DFJ73DRAFT_155542 [Zopfochytrium polystomum]|nr:hypothetical protein DFJ73DRAFT_155542 [Zopfochytrium polystomum]
MFNKDCVLSVGDLLIDLADYCARKVAFLNAWEWPEPESIEQAKEKLLSKTDEESLLDSNTDLNFTIAVNALSIVRYISDAASDIPLAALTRLLNTNDMPCALVTLLERAPWLKRGPPKSGTSDPTFSRFENGAWKNIPQEDLPRIGKVEGQIWIALHCLLTDPECRRKYVFTARSKEILLRLKECLDETTVDQLPILVDVQRYMEELLLMDPPIDPSITRSGLLIEQVSETYHELLVTTNFKAIANDFRKACMSPELSQEDLLQRFGSTYNFSNLEQLLEDPTCAKCGMPAESRCSQCRSEWYCS